MTASLALRNLFQSRARLLASVGGVALALLLILALDGVVAGFDDKVVAYINHAGADVWVAQAGVRNMHMASSTLPGTDVPKVAAVSGVATTAPILYMTDIIAGPAGQQWAYLIGLAPDSALGGPPAAEGQALPGPGQAVMDKRTADGLGIPLGGSFSVLGRPFRLAGLSRDTSSPLLAVLFISAADFEALRNTGHSVSYILVRVAPSADADTVAGRIEQQVPGVTALSRHAFAASEQATINNMTAGIIMIMNAAAFAVGLAVVAVTVYTTTLSRRAEYGTLKAVGAANRRLYSIVVIQAVGSVALALVGAIVVTVILGVVLPVVQPALSVELLPVSVLKSSAVAVVIAALAAMIPIRQVAGVDPAAVFRRKLA